MRILLTGKNGQVGFELRRSLALLGEVRALGSAECDLADEGAIRKEVRAFQPDIVVNPAAYTAVDKAESEQAQARAVNEDAPRVLAEEAERLGAVMVQFSTDYVFDGTKAGAYIETDATNPQGVYGATKRAGELAVQARCSRHFIFRTSWVLGGYGNNFAKTMLRLAAERDALGIVGDQFGAPTSAALLADVTAHVLRRGESEDALYGTYHVVPAGVTNWHEYACYVIERARAAGRPIRVAPEAIRSIATSDYPTPAKRPANSVLDTTKLREAFGLHLPGWQHGVDHILDQIL